MVIVFQSMGWVSSIPAILLVPFANVFYLRLGTGVVGRNILSKILRKINIRQLPVAEYSMLGDVRRYDYGYEDDVFRQFDRMFPEKLFCELHEKMQTIEDLKSKLRAAFASNVCHADVGVVSMCMFDRCATERIVFVHTRISSYVFGSSGVRDAEKYNFLLFPSEDIWSGASKIFNKIKAKLLLLMKMQVNGERANNLTGSRNGAVGIIYHQSTNYGKLFQKTQYFSSDTTSALHPNRVLCFVLGRIKQPDEWGVPDNIELLDMAKISRIKDLFQAFLFFCFLLRRVKSLNEFFGGAFLAAFWYSYVGWSRALEQYPGLTHVILDYDILFPKPLAVALESRCIKSIAMQERGSFSFASNYGVVVDTYLFSGGLFTEYGVKNKAIACNVAVDFGQWRSSLFFAKELPFYGDLSYINFANSSLRNYHKMICCLGWFTDFDGLQPSPFVNISASKSYYSCLKELALRFDDVAFVLRLKSMNERELALLGDCFDGVDNIFICDDYSVKNVSYALCAQASVIVSVQTSLAEECLAIGKKVVFVNSIHNMENICSNIYPKDFHFAFAGSSTEAVRMVESCLNEDVDLARAYNTLQSKLSGDCDFSESEAIPRYIERYIK